MRRIFLSIIIAMSTCSLAHAQPTTQPRFRALAFYSTDVETDHVQFAWDILAFYNHLSRTKNFKFDATTDWKKLNTANLAKYNLILWIDDFPHTDEQRHAFEDYMSHGGGWIGFHVAGYNDKDTHWPWFVDFMGGAVFYTNNWPVMPAKLTVDSTDHPATSGLPSSYTAPANEFYQWRPSPRLNKDVKVLLTLDPSNFPLGKKDLITDGDTPVVWTNTKYNMLYINMGHGFNILDEPIQNKLFTNAIDWLGTTGKYSPATTQPATQP